MKTTNWNELAQRVHQNAIEKGFWKEEKSDEHSLMLVITEISEAVEADRKGNSANVEYYKNFLKEEGRDFDKSGFKWNVKDTVEDELADVVIRLLDIAGARGFDLSKINEIEEPIIEDFESLSFTEIALSLCVVVSCSVYDGTKSTIIGSIYHVTQWCQHLNINLEWHINQKMKYNASREPMHGKKY